MAGCTLDPPSLRDRKIIKTQMPFHDCDLAARFSVVSYNILADCHTQASYYPYREPQYLEQDFRHEVLLQELRYLDADVFCLQEVGTKYFAEKMEPELRKMGYVGLFAKRTIHRYNEGLATFFKTSKFSLVESKLLHLDDLAEEAISSVGITNENFKSRYSNGRGCVLQMTSLRSAISNDVITFANTHLVWQGPKIPDVRCLQAACSMEALDTYKNDESVGVVLCGDFNAEPRSTTYSMVTKAGDLGDSIEEVKPYLDEYWMSNFEMVIDSIKKNMKALQSSYKSVMGREVEVTNLDGSFQDCLDYIFYRSTNGPRTSQADLIPLEVLDVLPVEVMRQSLPPSSIYPSDHLPLRTVFGILRK